jgi:hypothetical protein
MAGYDVLCPLHSAAFVSTPDQPKIFAKINSTCHYEILRDDPERRMVKE